MFVTRRALTGSRSPLTASLRAQMRFDVEVHRQDLTTLLDDRYDMIVCAVPGVPLDRDGQVDSEHDHRELVQLARVLSHVRTRHLVVLSTVAVYGELPVADETSDVDAVGGESWARHRYWFEQKLREYHPSVVVLRVPLVFGPWLQGPSELLELERGSMPSGLPLDAALQCYDASRLASDLDRAVSAGLPLANLVGEPVPASELARACFGIELAAPTLDQTGERSDGGVPTGVPRGTDVRSVHAAVFGGTGSYVMDRADTIDAVARWARRRSPAAAVGGR